MDRRRFLEITGAVAAAALTGCGGGSSSSPTPTPTPTPSGPKWSDLASSMQGSLLVPGQDGYAQAAKVLNQRFNAIQPQAIARCASAQDVQAALAFAVANNVEITPRCGGHNYAGNSISTGLIIDLRAMNTVQVNNDGTATIGAGTLLVDVYDQLIAQGVSISSGDCPTVGISGITMGGGLSVVGRKYGLTCDNLVSAQVVTTDGRILTCDANNEPDLFWALRGGGGGNFGITTSFTFKTHPAQDLAVCTASFDWQDVPKMFSAWQNLTNVLPDEIWASIFLDFSSGAPAPTASVTMICVGTTADVTPYWNNFLTATQSTAIGATVTTKTYRDTMLGQCGSLTIPQCHLVGETSEGVFTPVSFVGSSDFFVDPMPTAGIQALMNKMEASRAAGTYGYVIFDLMQGAYAQPAPGDTAFVHRNALFSAQYWLYIVNPTDPVTWANDTRNIMSTWSSGQAYVNYMDPLIQNWQDAYYGANYSRLSQIKTEYDPHSVLDFPQGVEPA